MGLRRRQDWPLRFLEAVEAKKDTRFSPGIHDCCISACDIIKHITGTDIAVGFRNYRGKQEMLKTLSAHGGVESIAETIMKANVCAEIPIALASRGDMVMLDTPDGPTLAVVDTDGINAVACGTRGWKRPPVKSRATRAWRIG